MRRPSSCEHHTEDEVRFAIAGHGLFGVHLQDPETIFEVHVGRGDLLGVPRGTWHWFDLTEDRRTQTIRRFQDTSDWSPHCREVAAASE